MAILRVKLYLTFNCFGEKAMHIFTKAQMAANKNAHNDRHHFLSGLSQFGVLFLDMEVFIGW